MNLLVIRPLVDSGPSSHLIAKRISDWNFDIIHFILKDSESARCAWKSSCKQQSERDPVYVHALALTVVE
jgi:hypothetical protein